MNTDNYVFEIPATRGVQGGVEQYMLTVPMAVLRRLLAMDDQGDVMARSQREANRTRARKIRNYVAEATGSGKPYILPSITGNIDIAVDFLPSELSPSVGILKIPMEADLKLFDGQHRALGIMDFVRDYSNTSDTISLLLTVGLPLEMRQQFFADINNNASKPAAAISMAYNNNDPVNQLAMYLAQKVPGLAGAVDFEHNAVPQKSSRLISFKALNDATKKMLGLRANSVPDDQQRDTAEKLWAAWADAMRWLDIAQDDYAAEYRQEALGLHGIMINAMGMATAQMLKNRSPESIITLLSRAGEGQNGFHYRESFLHEQWHDICVDPATRTVRTDRRALEATAMALIRLIDPLADCVWLRSYVGDEVPDATLVKFHAEIIKMQNDINRPRASIESRLEQLKDAEPEEKARVLGKIQAFKKFMLDVA
ncbi:DGQHR domain-containing protein [Salmonella enterica subsp. enterica serovar Meleagridis]|nr:DGQHR domain-containing protein [Salmonella enterica subsp. enterica serovar Cerro]EGD4263654.1 DGQHR domain-containing protein [Salmonella enterica subsp. enterica serovar Cerro]EGD4268210.1 DGQHR domain-containing protein [Salmonella enterica subsp. enterica serovar Cerro]EGD4276718.1 DGQHR domain-containing protein [Salmonella enterica subsp. enterica serovar Meleagridis]EGD4286756.1 DGQHR domain-containing protein [Salmonella enterica subsp. enterica serovar Meleagridis]